MYWPFGTPKCFATSSNSGPEFNLIVSDDGLPSPFSEPPTSFQTAPASPDRIPNDDQARHPGQDDGQLATPATPLTPAVQSVDHDHGLLGTDPNGSPSQAPPQRRAPTRIPLKDPILALRVSRSGHLFAVITAASMTIWQSKPTVVLAVVVRSQSSLETYGENVDLLLRPDSAILVVHTALGYLITYSLATDTEAQVYRPFFPNYSNIQRRRQIHVGPGSSAPDQFLWGPGEGGGVRDVSVRFRMVIKVDAGIESALALDDELIVATRKPAAIQCIRWTPDNSGSQTRTEMVTRMGWLDRKVTVVEMTHDRPMNLSTWITNDGKAHAVQRITLRYDAVANGTDPKKLFKGHCFHSPREKSEYARRVVINARFSLIAVGCANGDIQVYSARDYAGNIPPSHTHSLPVSAEVAGALTTLCYSPDGYCLFAGFSNGWAMWSVYGKLGSHSFGSPGTVAMSTSTGENWMCSVVDAAWLGNGSELFLISSQHEAIWSLEIARSAVAGCYNSANLARTVLQTSTSVMIYRGYNLPDLASISAEPSLWHTTRIPAAYLLNQWPIRHTVISPDGRYVAVAGRHGLAHYSVNSGRWKTFASETMENEFLVRGGMCWYQHILVAAVEVNKTYELRLYSRELALESSLVLHSQRIPAPIVLIASSGEDSLLVYTYENLLYHFIFAPYAGSVRLVQLGQIAFHGIVRSPARVRGLSWILPESQMIDGDPSQDVSVASVLFLVDAKLVLLRPSLNQEGHLKYDMRVISQNVEFYVSMRDVLTPEAITRSPEEQQTATDNLTLRNSLWVFDGKEFRLWPEIHDVMRATSSDTSRELPPTVSIPVDFYPLSTALSKGIILGVEADLAQRRDLGFSFFRFAIRTHLFIPDVLRFLLCDNRTSEAVELAEQYQGLDYFAHALEMLLHKTLDEEVDSAPAPEQAILPRVLSLLSSFREYLDIVVQCTRKTEVRQWRTLFAYLPPVQELFEESLQQGFLKTAGGYLIVLHTLDETGSAPEQTVRLLSYAMRARDWELCKELARFLAAMDETGNTLREAVDNVKAPGMKTTTRRMDRLDLPSFPSGRRNMNGSGSKGSENGEDSDGVSGSDIASLDSARR
ncbi:RIC1-domain-containing protein [Sodiomyces alkalinus F11]|uniref:RIC1-domain-containing protein n=1 Tax=Sodiomyces alkalinus (strain CBS 110278 / VKM F-3762 / F11) TaxID=1314773 RepID=A0A3N2PR76_SODAK|nr:RIC1-domain-containing protein [Sodiomyces alkalinus F11]ROT37019.1 RIC1-domain-containing protein [Sodiomyces alkalinus F11]